MWGMQKCLRGNPAGGRDVMHEDVWGKMYWSTLVSYSDQSYVSHPTQAVPLIIKRRRNKAATPTCTEHLIENTTNCCHSALDNIDCLVMTEKNVLLLNSLLHSSLWQCICSLCRQLSAKFCNYLQLLQLLSQDQNNKIYETSHPNLCINEYWFFSHSCFIWIS